MKYRVLAGGIKTIHSTSIPSMHGPNTQFNMLFKQANKTSISLTKLTHNGSQYLMYASYLLIIDTFREIEAWIRHEHSLKQHAYAPDQFIITHGIIIG